MLQFYSANVRAANTERAVSECFGKAFGKALPGDLRVVAVYATLGHKLSKVHECISALAPGVRVVGACCGGVIGPEGPGESMNELAILGIAGDESELSIASAGGVTFENSRAKSREVAQALGVNGRNVPAVFITVPGFDCACDSVVEGFDEVLGAEVPLFGGVSSDNMKNIASYQLIDGEVGEHTIWAVALMDPTLGTVSRATHGFEAIGQPMVVTKSNGTRILELDGQNALAVYSERFKLTEKDGVKEIMPFGAMAEELPKELWEEYGSPYILQGIMGRDAETGELLYRVHFNEGTALRQAIRNEALIFSEMKRVLSEMRQAVRGPVLAVLQADCIARGRFSLNAVMKDELIGMMHDAFRDDAGQVPAWLGMYGFGEFAMLGGQNRTHTYTTSLMAIYRKA